MKSIHGIFMPRFFKWSKRKGFFLKFCNYSQNIIMCRHYHFFRSRVMPLFTLTGRGDGATVTYGHILSFFPNIFLSYNASGKLYFQLVTWLRQFTVVNWFFTFACRQMQSSHLIHFPKTGTSKAGFGQINIMK